MLGIGLGLTSRGVLGGGVPSWVLSGSSLDLYFSQNKFYGGAVLNTSRASSGYAEDNAGVWTLFGNNVARRTDKGLLVEESRTNSIRNNSMQGASAGSPGTLPTNWISNLDSALTRTVAVGTSLGIDYFDVTQVGTTATTGGSLNFEGTKQVAATVGQTWTLSGFFALPSGSTANITSISLLLIEKNSAGTTLTIGVGSSFAGSLTSALQRFSLTYTTVNASTEFVQPAVQFSYANGAVINITLRIGWPQLELGAFATSPIRTTNAAATRAADTITLATGSVFNASAGTVFAQFLGPPVNLNRVIWQLSDGSFNNRILLRAVHAGATTNVFGVNGGVTDGILLFVGAPVQNAAYKIAAAYSLNDFAGSKNAATVVTDTTAAVPSMTTLYIGQENGVNTSNNYIQRLSYFNSRLPNATLQSITQ